MRYCIVLLLSYTHCLPCQPSEDELDTTITLPRSSALVDKVRLATRDRANSSPYLPNTTGKIIVLQINILKINWNAFIIINWELINLTPFLFAVLKARESVPNLEFDHTHFADSAADSRTPAPPVKQVFYNEPYAQMEASIENKLDQDDINLLMDMNRRDDELTGITREKSHDNEHSSHDTGSESGEESYILDSESHTELTQSHDTDPPSHDDQIDGSDIVFTDVDDKTLSESPISQKEQGTYIKCHYIHSFFVTVTLYTDVGVQC